MDFGTTYFIHKYIAPASGKARNLLLLVHGRTGNLKLLEWYAKRFQIPELAFMTIQAPYPDRRSDQKEEGFSWYLENGEGIEKSRADLRAMIEELHHAGLNYQNIYWLGFSQGSVMGLDLALRLDQILGGFLCISGFCFKPDEYPAALGKEARHQRILVTHGTRDEVVDFDRAKKSYDKVSALGVPLEFKVYDKPHSFHLRQEVPDLEQQLKNWIQAS